MKLYEMDKRMRRLHRDAAGGDLDAVERLEQARFCIKKSGSRSRRSNANPKSNSATEKNATKTCPLKLWNVD